MRRPRPRHPAGSLIGLAATGGVITSAGIVLAGTFAALGTLPLVFITEIGFAVAFGVLLDTFVVRSVLVTALNLDVGRWIWWPSSLHHKHDDLDLDQPQRKPPRSAAEQSTVSKEVERPTVNNLPPPPRRHQQRSCWSWIPGAPVPKQLRWRMTVQPTDSRFRWRGPPGRGPGV